MTTDIALARPDPTLDEGSFRLMMAAAQRYVQSGLLPPTIKTPQAALLLIKQGRELGVPDTYALRNITVINGKPTCSAELMMALVRRSYGHAAMRVFKTDNTACTVQYRQQGWDGVSEFTFSIDDAKRADLLKNPTWSKYPAAMLRARCISAVVRFAFPECIAGLYTPEELGADVTVTDEGAVEVIDVTPEPRQLRPVVADPDGSTLAITDEDERRAREVMGVEPTEAEGDRRILYEGKRFTREQLEGSLRRGQEGLPGGFSDEDIRKMDDDLLCHSLDTVREMKAAAEQESEPTQGDA